MSQVVGVLVNNDGEAFQVTSDGDYKIVSPSVLFSQGDIARTRQAIKTFQETGLKTAYLMDNEPTRFSSDRLFDNFLAGIVSEFGG